MTGAPAPYAATFDKAWWENRWLLLAVVLAMTVPLLWPDIPPFTDLPGHMGRYRVQLEIGGPSGLDRFYEFHWALIANLGVDLLIEPLAPMIGLEPAVKLIAAAVPALTAAGALLVAREVHGRVPPTAFFALPLAYNHAFLFGFLNFALSMALALLALGLWLRLDRQGRHGLRALLFVPLSLILWVVHIYGWGLLGAAAFSAEVVRAWDRGARPPWKAIWRGGLAVLPLAPPFLLILLWRGQGSTGGTGAWFDLDSKLLWLVTVLRDRWQWWDMAGVGVVVVVLLAGTFNRQLQFSRNLLASALFLALLFALLPRILFGSNFADMRLAPYLFLIAVLAIRLSPAATARTASALAAAGLLFVGARLAGNTLSALEYDRLFDRELAALPHVPFGARLVSLVGRGCTEEWAKPRVEHLPGIALVRRRAFSNDQWVMAGAQLLRVDYPRGEPFTADPSQIVTPRGCRAEQWMTVDEALASLPRGAFDYLWLIGPPPYDAGLVSGFTPVWRSGSSMLFRLPPSLSSATSDTPRGSDTRPTR